MKLFRISVAILLFFTAISSLVGGVSLITDPTGASLGLHTDILKGSLFEDFFIPGMILAVIVGGSNFLAGVAVLAVTEKSPKLVLAAGTCLICYIIAEYILIKGQSFLQIICLAIGTVLILVGVFLLKKSQAA